jgi:hypothetical protein
MAAKSQKAKIAYLKSDGSEAANVASGDIATIQFRFVDGLGNLDISLANVPSNVMNTALIRGLAEKVRDEYASSESADEAFDWAKSVIERLLGDEWFGEREGGGPSISYFVEAVRALKEQASLPFDEAACRQKYIGKDKIKVRNAALNGNSGLRAVYSKLIADAAALKASKAAEAAEKASKAASEASKAAPAVDAGSL